MEMKKYKLGDLIDVSRGKSLAGEFYATSGNLVRLTMGNFDYINNCFKRNTSKDNLFFSGKVEEKFILKAGDIITPLTEQTPGLLGSTARIPESGKYIQSQDVALVKCKKDKLDDGFAYYLVSSESVKKQLGAAAQQTKIRHTSPDRIKDCTVYIPEISIQKKIGNVFSSLDKRIENLRTQNRVLERTAKTIYDYTFLQCAGRKTVYNKILKRNIPEGWEVKKIGELAEIVNGATPSTAVDGNFDGDIVWITPKDLSDQKSKFVYFGERTITLQGYDSCSTTLVPVDSILMSSRAPIGLVSIAKCELCTNQGFKTFVPKSDGYTEYLYYYLLTNMKKIEQLGAGTTFKEVSRGSLTSFPVIAPDEKSLATFNASIKPIFRKQLVNTKQIETLTTQRNTLLPLLMNGQVTIK